MTFGGKKKKTTQINEVTIKQSLILENLHRQQHNGLTTEEVETRVRLGFVNEAAVSASKTIREIITENVFTYYNLIFTVFALLLITVGSFRDLAFMGVVICNTAIGIIQEIRAKSMLDKLRLLNEPKATVLRDGVQQKISVEELVQDDHVLIQAGMQIPADAVVLSGTINVNEALLTGEADEITKTAGDALLSGSLAVSGSCSARLTAVGKNAYISRLTEQATQAKRGEQSEMIRSLNRLVKVVGLLIIPIGIVLFLQQYLMGESIRNSIVAMVAAVLGMIPEGLYLLASLAMVVSTMRLAANRVLIHDMKCIESLARVDVLCVDKTGTITENTMKVEQVIPMNGTDPAKLEALLCGFVQGMNRDNATMETLQQYFTRPSDEKPLHVFGFSSEWKYCGACMPSGNYVLGAPEFVLRAQYDAYRDVIHAYSARGSRVLVFARYNGVLNGKQLIENAEPMAMLLLSNPVRAEAAETFAYFAQNDVDIKVISGDNPVTVSYVAGQAGILNADRYVDATKLKTTEELEAAMLRYTVFGRVTPTQKREMVQALKKHGKTVCMTGDGVNDVLALKEADCSVAMASGSEAAAQIAQLVLLDSDFSKMPSVVAEGRRVVNNIERSASLFLVKNIFSFLLAVFALISSFTYPLRPSQVSLVGMFTIGIPSFLLALEPNHSLITGRFLPNVLRRAFPAGVTNFLCAAALMIYGNVLQLPDPVLSTVCAVLISFVGFVVLCHIAAPINRMRGGMIALLMGGWVFCAIVLKDLFALEPLGEQALVFLLVLCATAVIIFVLMNLATARLWDKLVALIFGWVKDNKFSKKSNQALLK